jgi:putative FmdB family regulatory protein
MEIKGEPMPIYEYICNSCKTITEFLQKSSEQTPQKCINCNKKNTLIKIISPTSFLLKGGGWYKDLYSSTQKKIKKSSNRIKKNTKIKNKL